MWAETARNDMLPGAGGHVDLNFLCSSSFRRKPESIWLLRSHLHGDSPAKIKMDSGFRRNDEEMGCIVIRSFPVQQCVCAG